MFPDVDMDLVNDDCPAISDDTRGAVLTTLVVVD
jgi:hypothetical protein